MNSPASLRRRPSLSSMTPSLYSQTPSLLSKTVLLPMMLFTRQLACGAFWVSLLLSMIVSLITRDGLPAWSYSVQAERHPNYFAYSISYKSFIPTNTIILPSSVKCVCSYGSDFRSFTASSK